MEVGSNEAPLMWCGHSAAAVGVAKHAQKTNEASDAEATVLFPPIFQRSCVCRLSYICENEVMGGRREKKKRKEKSMVGKMFTTTMPP